MDYSRQILNGLVDKYEKSKAGEENRRRTFYRIERRTLPRYFDDTSAYCKVEVNETCRSLAARGWVDLYWQKYEEGNLLEKVILCPDKLSEIYSYLKRLPRQDKFAQLQDMLTEQDREAPEWLAEFFHFVMDRLANNQTPIYLDPELSDKNQQVLAALQALTRLEGEVPRRIFSQRVLGNSKAFDALESAVVRIIRDFYPGDLPEDRKDLLAVFGLVDNPRHVFVSGDLTLAVDGKELPLEHFYPDVGLPAGLIDRANVTGLSAARLITVENLTSFYQLVTAKGPETLAVYLGGYPNRTRLRLLEKIRDFIREHGSNLQWCHWGDLDLGGLQIFSFLKRQLGVELRPWLMDCPTLEKYSAQSQPFDNNYAAKLAALREREEYAEFRELLAMMLQKRIRLEQEAVRLD